MYELRNKRWVPKGEFITLDPINKIGLDGNKFIIIA